MKRYCSLLFALVLLAVVGSCSKTTTVDLRGRLLNAPEDYFLVVCETGEQLWVDLYALQPWWSQMTSAVDAGPGLAPPLYVDMTAKVESNGPYGHAAKTNRAVVAVDEIRMITATIPADCSP